MKSNNKAFTLIELLAIIVILAIIAVITVPIILNIIDNSRKGAATDSAYGYKDAVNKWYVEELSKNHNFMLKSEYTVQDGKIIDANDSNDQGVLIPVSGEKPSSGELHYSNNVLKGGCLVVGDYAVTFKSDGSVDKTEKGDCSDYEFSTENWDNYITPTQLSGGSSLPTGSTVWIQENTNSGLKEACAILNEKKVCFAYNSSGYKSCFTDAAAYPPVLSGYIAEMKTAMETAGFFIDYDYGNGSCYIDENDEPVCALWAMKDEYSWSYACAVDADGSASCYYGSNSCYLLSTGETFCK